MLSCLQRPRSGRWRALISLHTQRLRSITSSSLPSRSRAGGGGSGSGSGSGSAGWVCAPSSRPPARDEERKAKGGGGQGPQSDQALSPTAKTNVFPQKQVLSCPPRPVSSPPGWECVFRWGGDRDRNPPLAPSGCPSASLDPSNPKEWAPL